MRLLQAQADGGFILTNYEYITLPPYAVLSHTWGNDGEELTFEDLEKGVGTDKAGHQKLVFCSKQAKKDDLQFFWMDTCCIDKRSSSELQEAINSMFKWYGSAAKCYVYLSDVSVDATSRAYQPFMQSRWFTRGWTLQELLAPTSVEFFSVEGLLLGDRDSLLQDIAQVTKIPAEALRGKDLSEFSVEMRMGWSEGRHTKREEDAAYSLLGIFNVHMPLIYGEGREKALRRLRKEIRETLDEALGTHVQRASTRNSPRSEEEMLSKIRRWLSAPDPSTNQHKAEKQRQANTGLWFTESKHFARWKMDAASRLWLYGIPGCGKTILSSTIVQNLLQHCSNVPSSVTAYFYFDFNNSQKQDPELMLRSLLCQLLQRSVRVPESLDALFSSCEDGQQQPSLHALLVVTKQMIRDFTHVYVILDALDECTQRPELMDLLETVAGWEVKSLHLLMTSRRDRDIESSLNIYVTQQDIVCLQSEVVDEDIQRYIRQRLSDDKSLAKWNRDAGIRQEIETALKRGACGM